MCASEILRLSCSVMQKREDSRPELEATVMELERNKNDRAISGWLVHHRSLTCYFL